ncbi:MAG: preprotein translocase subunit SecE [Myxococcota bacterium]|nr:preprotein translocase subunit SecE [Myxococcota bacterium]
MVQIAPDLVRRHSRWIGMTTLVSALSLAWVCSFAFAAAFASFTEPGTNRPVVLGVRMSGVLAVAIGIITVLILQRHARYLQYTAEVVEELRQCVFPNKAETKSDSIVVIIFSVIIGGILWIFDSMSGAFTSFLYDLI